MLTTPYNVLLFPLLGDGMQNKLFQHLSRDRGETDWPVVSRILLLAFLKGSLLGVRQQPTTAHSSPQQLLKGLPKIRIPKVLV